MELKSIESGIKVNKSFRTQYDEALGEVRRRAVWGAAFSMDDVGRLLHLHDQSRDEPEGGERQAGSIKINQDAPWFQLKKLKNKLLAGGFYNSDLGAVEKIDGEKVGSVLLVKGDYGKERESVVKIGSGLKEVLRDIYSVGPGGLSSYVRGASKEEKRGVSKRVGEGVQVREQSSVRRLLSVLDSVLREMDKIQYDRVLTNIGVRLKRGEISEGVALAEALGEAYDSKIATGGVVKKELVSGISQLRELMGNLEGGKVDEIKRMIEEDELGVLGSRLREIGGDLKKCLNGKADDGAGAKLEEYLGRLMEVEAGAHLR
ncbi:MAG: hypothetical protein UY11_C0023G0017 [Candidatus Amesbacteria bacterium GW2011_GWC2_47_8]|uniref:Uncharacterized protein n=1 Tax=Candidatus Amesbacteria bacterium GW2011_GWC2_47_8 TaxID=1618367 RepID=A0A0G1TNC1_9BACT|nr:MAG: hypothetical protein UY11_C0023G0017 [Candidatus Amesbacteria bacterium GW2011_GWC2_47_8]